MFYFILIVFFFQKYYFERKNLKNFLNMDLIVFFLSHFVSLTNIGDFFIRKNILNMFKNDFYRSFFNFYGLKNSFFILSKIWKNKFKLKDDRLINFINYFITMFYFHFCNFLLSNIIYRSNSYVFKKTGYPTNSSLNSILFLDGLTYLMSFNFIEIRVLINHYFLLINNYRLNSINLSNLYLKIIFKKMVYMNILESLVVNLSVSKIIELIMNFFEKQKFKFKIPDIKINFNYNSFSLKKFLIDFKNLFYIYFQILDGEFLLFYKYFYLSYYKDIYLEKDLKIKIKKKSKFLYNFKKSLWVDSMGSFSSIKLKKKNLNFLDNNYSKNIYILNNKIINSKDLCYIYKKFKYEFLNIEKKYKVVNLLSNLFSYDSDFIVLDNNTHFCYEERLELHNLFLKELCIIFIKK